MRPLDTVLIADDDPVSRTLLERTLREAGYQIIAVSNGSEALVALEQPEGPSLAILDWMMPEIDGLHLCRTVRGRALQRPYYLILLTSKRERQDIVTGLQAGADDYIVKPFERAELLARVHVGFRMAHLQTELSARARELEWALGQVKQLRGLLPICSYCKRIRDDQNFWRQVEEYVMAHTDVQFSHGVCPTCYESQIHPQLEAIKTHRSIPS